MECRQCQDGWVNANDKVTLLAGCRGDALCNERGLRFRWKLSVVEGEGPGDEADPIVDAHSDCVMADGSSYRSLRRANTTVAAAVQTTAGTTTGKPLTTTTAKRPTLAQVSSLDSGMGELDYGNAACQCQSGMGIVLGSADFRFFFINFQRGKKNSEEKKNRNKKSL